MNIEVIKLQDGREVKLDRSVEIMVCAYTILDGELYILSKRGGRYEIPCDYLNWDESGEQAAARILFEQTGISVKATHIREFDHSLNPSSEHFQNVVFVYQVCISPNELKNRSDLEWTSNTEVDDYEWNPYHRKEVINFLNINKPY